MTGQWRRCSYVPLPRLPCATGSRGRSQPPPCSLRGCKMGSGLCEVRRRVRYHKPVATVQQFVPPSPCRCSHSTTSARKMDGRSGPGAAVFLPASVAPSSHVILSTGLSHDDGQLSLTTTAAVGSTVGSTVGWPSSAVRSAAADVISRASASTESSVGVPAAAAAVFNAAAAIFDGITAAALVHGPLPAPADGQASAAPQRPPTPRTPRERLSLLLRCAFRHRTRRHASMLSFMGIVAVTWKLDCPSAINNGGDQELLRVLLLELFSEPVSALRFMEETFGVVVRGMHLRGRLAEYKHTSGQPASFSLKEL